MAAHLQKLDRLAPAGYTVGLHIRFASPLYLRSTYPQAWQDLYTSNAYSLRDPLVFWGISRAGQIRWSEITLPDPFGVLEKARDHGLTYGAMVSCGKITSRTIVGVARADREFTDAEIDEVAVVAHALHEITEPPENLTPDMAEALQVAADGLPGREAAAKLGISESAYDSRLSSARDLLGARTTAEALKMAREFRLI